MIRATSRMLHPRGRLLPDHYPRGYERVVELRDGRVITLRPIVPSDLEDLRRAVAEADPDTLRSRFLGGRPPESDEEFTRLVAVDYDRRFAIVARSDDGAGIGIARYEAIGDGTEAEVAVAVDPAWRRVGVATALLHLLGEAAVDNGIERFDVEFVLANVDVGALLAESHLPMVLRRRNGVGEAQVDLTALVGDQVEECAAEG
jgi:GNAT superfamily N-acetyltransferase